MIKYITMACAIICFSAIASEPSDILQDDVDRKVKLSSFGDTSNYNEDEVQVYHGLWISGQITYDNIPQHVRPHMDLLETQ